MANSDCDTEEINEEINEEIITEINEEIVADPQPNTYRINPFTWITNNKVRTNIKNYISSSIVHNLRDKLTTEDLSKFKNSKGEISIIISLKLTNFIMFLINEIAHNLKDAINTTKPFEIENVLDTDKLKLHMAKRMERFDEKSLIKFINMYYVNYSSINKTTSETTNKFITFFNKNINSGDCSLFQSDDIHIFNTMIIRFLSIFIHLYLVRIKLKKDIKTDSIIGMFMEIECEKGYDNVYKLSNIIDGFNTNYKNVKVQINGK